MLHTIPTISLKINHFHAYIMLPACHFLTDEFRRFQVYLVANDEMIVVPAWHHP